MNLKFERGNAQLKAQEVELMNEFNTRFQQFLLWMQVSSDREHERAAKRLKTQSAFVQASEHDLQQKQAHCERFSARSIPVSHATTHSTLSRVFENVMQYVNRILRFGRQ
ncbi:hypothetical protein LTR66_015723, partial [Elasticomyces elasticus]